MYSKESNWSKYMTEIENTEKPKVEYGFFYKVKMFFLATIVVFLLIAIVLQNTKLKEDFIKLISPPNNVDEIAQINNQISTIKTTLDSKIELNQDFSDLSARFEVLEQNNLNTIKSKADVSLIIGVIERLDRLESKVFEIAKISDQGSLVLSASMLLKERALSGNEFIYEYSVLKGLAEGNSELLGYIEEIAEFSSKGIYTKGYLIREFEDIYSAVVNNEIIEAEIKDNQNENLKNFNQKFGKLLTFKVKKPKDAEEIKEANVLDSVLYLVQKDELKTAITELNKEKYQEILQKNEFINLWIQKVKDKERFDKSLSRISSYGMGLMKANYLR